MLLLLLLFIFVSDYVFPYATILGSLVSVAYFFSAEVVSWMVKLAIGRFSYGRFGQVRVPRAHAWLPYVEVHPFVAVRGSYMFPFPIRVAKPPY